MPANLSQEAKGKWTKVTQAKKPKDKLAALNEFLSAIPKHKGNERLRMQIKRKISDLKEELETKKHHTGKSVKRHVIERTGAAQVVMLGLTNAGKSSLMQQLTNARPAIGDYSYTTTEPVPGIMHYEDIAFQLIELPAFRFTEQGQRAAGILNGTDGLVILLDRANDIEEQLKYIAAELENIGITFTPPQSSVEIDPTGKGGAIIQLTGKLLDCTHEDVKRLLLQYGLKNVKIRLKGSVKFDDIEEAILESKKAYKPAIILINKSDLSVNYHQAVVKKVAPGVPLLEVSSKTGTGLKEVPQLLFKRLGIVRVYTKEPGVRANSDHPFTLRKDAKVSDLAKMIHTELLERFKYAKVWGASSRYPGERVGLTHELADKDIVEIHT